MDPRQRTVALLGPVEWESEVTGFCQCPGVGLHTQAGGKRDCRVSIDGAPTIYCFHASCVGAVAEANKRLRRELGGHGWAVQLPGGAVVQSGGVARAAGRPETASNERFPAGFVSGGDGAAVDLVTVQAERYRPQLFEFFRWPFAEILAGSPLLVGDRESDEQFRTWLKLWPADSTVWVGDVFSSGRPEHATHFRSVAEWYQIGPVMGNYTCGSAFRPGTWRRSNECLSGFRFLVIESDTLSRDEVGAVFAYLSRRLHYTLHAIVDTAGKSLHGWFDAPRDAAAAARLKAGLVVFGCDPKVFTWSQPVRVPGAFRDGKLQRLVWLRH